MPIRSRHPMLIGWWRSDPGCRVGGDERRMAVTFTKWIETVPAATAISA